MDELINLLLILFGWLLLDTLGFISLIRPIKPLRDWIKNYNLKQLLKDKHAILFIVVELIGFIILLSSFFLPWFYQEFLNITKGVYIIYYSFIGIINLDHFITLFIYYAYIIGIIIIVIKTSMKKKILFYSAGELVELMLLILGIMIVIIFLRSTPDVHSTLIPEVFYRDSGYSSGFILYTTGYILLFINGLQMSIYLRLVQNKR